MVQRTTWQRERVREALADARATAAQHGFTQAEHIVDIFGLCATCTAATQPDAVATPTPESVRDAG